jgi:hypothetical protein
MEFIEISNRREPNVRKWRHYLITPIEINACHGLYAPSTRASAFVSNFLRICIIIYLVLTSKQCALISKGGISKLSISAGNHSRAKRLELEFCKLHFLDCAKQVTYEHFCFLAQMKLMDECFIKRKMALTARYDA